MFPDAAGVKRRQVMKQALAAGLAVLAVPALRTAETYDGDPCRTLTSPGLKREFLRTRCSPSIGPGGRAGRCRVTGVDHHGNRIEATV